jgi:hypothetical protein
MKQMTSAIAYVTLLLVIASFWNEQFLMGYRITNGLW